MPHQALLNTAARAKDNFWSGINRESALFQRGLQMLPRFHPLIQHLKKQPVCISSQCCRLQGVIAFGSHWYLIAGMWIPDTLGFPKTVPWQSLTCQQSTLCCSSSFLFLWQNCCKGAVCLARCELPAAKAGAPNPYLSHSLLAQY